ncbi:MAG: cupin domain-containing protein [Ilumatobacter sp.]|uniref:cupin domain-containing protein n=1 Tax=Ilumatobacter sp. TaxID=1967498 RepID=UPI0026282B1D|nr:cupin domain-containing protein [Ilumatobacter sp.]MDJ0769219.1 cupin domain-containing protein [Ilumatobacter sp.]
MESFTPAEIARADEELAFTAFAAFNDQHLGVFRVTSVEGAGPWEMHPDTDELLHVLEGSVTVEVHDPDGNQLVPLRAGQLVVVPQGRWHRHVDAVDLVELFYTPGESLHTDDPAAEPKGG